MIPYDLVAEDNALGIGHAPDCGFHLDQYPWECTCGGSARPTCNICDRALYGQEAGMICRNAECPKRAKSSASETDSPSVTPTPSTSPHTD